MSEAGAPSGGELVSAVRQLSAASPDSDTGEVEVAPRDGAILPDLDQSEAFLPARYRYEVWEQRLQRPQCPDFGAVDTAGVSVERAVPVERRLRTARLAGEQVSSA